MFLPVHDRRVTKGLSARIVLSPVDRIEFPRDLTNSGLSQRSRSRFLPCRPGVSDVRAARSMQALASDQVYFGEEQAISSDHSPQGATDV